MLVYYDHREDYAKKDCYFNVNTPKTEAGKGKIVATIMGWDQKRKGLDLALLAIDRLRPKYDIILQIVAAANGESMEHQ